MRTALTLALVTGTMVGVAVPAAADPHGEFLAMTCSDGRSVSISPAPANGTFTPNFAAGSTAVFTPLSIQLTRTLRDGQGAVLSSEQAPAAVLGQGRQLERRSVVTCWAGESLSAAEDPEVPAGDTLDLAITLLGSWTPAAAAKTVG
jgi:hypothetical protein